MAVGSHGLVVRAPAAKAGGPGFNFQELPSVFFLFQLAYTNVDGMKDLWCSSTVWLLINTDVNQRVSLEGSVVL